MIQGLFLFLNMSGGEMVVIFLVFLMLFGSKNIPDIARTLGKAMRQFKDATGEIQRDIENSTRDFRNQVEKETRQIRSQVEVEADTNARELPKIVPPPPAEIPVDLPADDVAKATEEPKAESIAENKTEKPSE